MLGIAFGSGWALHFPVKTEMDRNGSAALRPLPGRPPSGNQQSVSHPARPDQAVPSGASAIPTSAPDALEALRAFDLPGAGMATPLEWHGLLANFAAQDPLTALTFIDTIPENERQAALATVLGAWAARDPAAAAAHVETEAGGLGLSPTDAIAGAGVIAGIWARLAPKAAAEWAAALPDDLQEEALPAAIGGMAAADPLAAKLFFEGLPGEDARARAVAPLAAQWARTDPSAASVWAGNLSTPEEQAAALAGLTTTWMQRDPGTASQWVKNLETGAGKDAAIAALVTAKSIRNDPEAALAWARTISDSDVRDSLTADIEQKIRLRDSLP